MWALISSPRFFERCIPNWTLGTNVPNVNLYLDEGQNEAQGGRNHDDEEHIQPDPGIGRTLCIHSLSVHSKGNHSDDEVGHEQQQEEHLLSKYTFYTGLRRATFVLEHRSLSTPVLHSQQLHGRSFLFRSVHVIIPPDNLRPPAPVPTPLALATYLGDGEVGSDLVAKLRVAEAHKKQCTGCRGNHRYYHHVPIAIIMYSSDTEGRLIIYPVSGVQLLCPCSE